DYTCRFLKGHTEDNVCGFSPYSRQLHKRSLIRGNLPTVLLNKSGGKPNEVFCLLAKHPQAIDTFLDIALAGFCEHFWRGETLKERRCHLVHLHVSALSTQHRRNDQLKR